jgi:hypothetical protein
MPRVKLKRFQPSELETDVPDEQRMMAMDAIRGLMGTPAWFVFCQKLETIRDKNDIRLINPKAMSMDQYGVAFGVQSCCEYVYGIFEEIIEEGQNVSARTKTK